MADCSEELMAKLLLLLQEQDKTKLLMEQSSEAFSRTATGAMSAICLPLVLKTGLRADGSSINAPDRTPDGVMKVVHCTAFAGTPATPEMQPSQVLDAEDRSHSRAGKPLPGTQQNPQPRVSGPWLVAAVLVLGAGIVSVLSKWLAPVNRSALQSHRRDRP